MASVMRYRRGDCQPIALPTAADGAVTSAIEVGDLVGVDAGVAYPASHWSTAAAFWAAFAGVALHKTGLKTGETSFMLTPDPGYTLVATAGEFEYDCANGITWKSGDLVAVYVTSGACVNQKVAAAANYATSIGVASVPFNQLNNATPQGGNNTTGTVLVKIKSTLLHGETLSGQ